MKTTLELELKLDVDPGFVLPDLGGEALPLRTFTSTYYDTEDRRLLRSGITLRRRVEARAGRWQLKLPSDEGRYELELPGGPARTPERFLDLLPALLRGGRTLEQVAKLRTQRDGVSVGANGSRVEVTIDLVSVLDGRRVASSFGELEAEVVDGDGAGLRSLGKTLRKSGAHRGDGLPKLYHALALPPAPAVSDDTEPGPRIRRLLADQYEVILASDPAVRLGEDPEAVHQLRVATRRARALLRAARGLVGPDWAEPLRAELGWLGALLGPVRDLDVLLEHLDAEAETIGGDDLRAFRRLRTGLAADREASRESLLEAMGSERYFALLDTLEGAESAPLADDGPALAEIAERAFERLRKAVKALPKRPSDEQLHRVRIQTKRSRYAAELAEPALKKAGKRLVGRAKTLQDVIGEHQDARVAEERIRGLAVQGDGRTGIAAGRLVERQRRRKRAARRAYPRAWRRLDKAGRAAFS
jgi:CHAD domain-containing protein